MTDTIDLAQFEGHKVIVTRKMNDGTLAEVEGACQSANELGVLIKPRGRASIEIIEAADIEQVMYAPDRLVKLKPRYVKELSYGQARRHLLDKHGASLAEVNSMSEADALELHNGIDHTASGLGLGHIHGERPQKEVVAAVEDGEDEDDFDDDFDDEE